jgi:uncharacterized protein (UPF0276 family)
LPTIDRVLSGTESRTENNVPRIATVFEFRYTKNVMTNAAKRQEQQQKFLKAKVAMALYSEYGRVPKEAEIDEVYHLTRILYKAVLGTHYLRKQQKKGGELVLF